MNRSSKKLHVIVAILIFVMAAIFLCYGIYMISCSLEYIRTYMEISTISFEDALQYVVSSAASYIGFAIVMAIGGFIVFSLRNTHFAMSRQHRQEDGIEDREEYLKADEEYLEDRECNGNDDEANEMEIAKVSEDAITDETEGKADEPPSTDVRLQQEAFSQQENIPQQENSPQQENFSEKENPEENSSDLIHTREFSLPQKQAIKYEEVMIPQETPSAPQPAAEAADTEKKSSSASSSKDTGDAAKEKEEDLRGRIQASLQTPQQTSGSSAQATDRSSRPTATPVKQQTTSLPQENKQQESDSGRNTNLHLDTDSWLKDFFADK